MNNGQAIAIHIPVDHMNFQYYLPVNRGVSTVSCKSEVGSLGNSWHWM